MGVITDQAKAVIDIDGRPASERMVVLKKEARQLRAEINGLYKAETLDVKLLAQKETRLKNINSQLRTTKKQTMSVKDAFKQLLPAMGIAAIVAGIGRIIKGFFELNKEMEIVDKKARVVFGVNFPMMKQEAEKTAKSIGLTTTEYIKAAAGVADLLVPLNMTRKASADMSKDIVNLSGALSEWSGGLYDSAQTSEILTKALLGETDQMKQLGIVIDQSSTDYNNRIKLLMKNENLTKEQARAQDIYNQIMEKSVDAQNAFKDGQTNLLRSEKSIKTFWRSLKESIASVGKDAFTPLLYQFEMFKFSINQLKKWSNEKLGTAFDVEPIENFSNALLHSDTVMNLLVKQTEKFSVTSEDGKRAMKELYEELVKRYGDDGRNLFKEYYKQRLAQQKRAEEIDQLENETQKKRQNELTSVIDAETKKRIEALMKLRDEIQKIQHQQELDLMSERDREIQLIHDKYADLYEEAKGHEKEMAQLKELETNDINAKKKELDEKAQKEKEEKEKEFQEKMYQYREEFSLVSTEELMNKELALLDEAYAERLEKDELYYMLRHEIFQKYFNMQREQENQAEEEKQEKQKELLDKSLADLSAKNDAISGMYQARTDLEYSDLEMDIANKQALIDKDKQERIKKLDAEYAEKRKMAKKDSEASKKLEQEYQDALKIIEEDSNNRSIALEEEKNTREKEIRKKYADTEFAVKIANIIANNAQAITKAVADLGPIAGPIAAAAYAVTGALQLNTARNQRKEVKQLAKGKYNVIGADDGRTYNASYTSSLSTGLVNSPVLVGEEPEIVIDTATTRNIMMNYPAIFDAINYARVPQRAEGNLPVNVSSSVNKDILMLQIESNARLQASIDELNRQLEEGLGFNYNKFETQMNQINSIKADITR